MRILFVDMDQMFEAILQDLVGDMAIEAMLNTGQLHKSDLKTLPGDTSKEAEELNKLTEEDLKLNPETNNKDKEQVKEPEKTK
jgi:hypothetical protein